MKLTRSEHHARAMLMGMKYLPKLGLYHSGYRFGNKKVDADTLEPLTWEEAVERIGNKPDDFVWYEELLQEVTNEKVP